VTRSDETRILKEEGRRFRDQCYNFQFFATKMAFLIEMQLFKCMYTKTIKTLNFKKITNFS
jgi:hypothetical protein